MSSLWVSSLTSPSTAESVRKPDLPLSGEIVRWTAYAESRPSRPRTSTLSRWRANPLSSGSLSRPCIGWGKAMALSTSFFICAGVALTLPFAGKPSVPKRSFPSRTCGCTCRPGLRSPSRLPPFAWSPGLGTPPIYGRTPAPNLSRRRFLHEISRWFAGRAAVDAVMVAPMGDPLPPRAADLLEVGFRLRGDLRSSSVLLLAISSSTFIDGTCISQSLTS